MTARTSDTKIVSVPWDDVPSIVGNDFLGSWFSASTERNTAFDEVTYVLDNAHELDGGNFPEGLMEGFYVLALLDHLVNEVVHVDDPGWSGWNYGLDRVRFVSPLTVNDRFRVRGTVREVTPRNGGYLVFLECDYEVEGRERPAMVAEWRVLWTLETGGSEE
ncbi:hypothetical protein ACGFZS_21595 [Streptomyces sp. NPDC048288]|uniref:hypothetical protein n=1 Tax=Streptomyces sp. NPDC048288 TaxID=3365529 RepID=UPI003719D771